MLNHKVLLAVGGKTQEPVRVTIGVISVLGTNIVGFTPASLIDKAPMCIATNGEKVWLEGLHDLYSDAKFKNYSYTQLWFSNTGSLDIGSFRVTRVDTKETFELHKKEDPSTFRGTLSTSFFHGLKRDDTVELLFDPIPVGYH